MPLNDVILQKIIDDNPREINLSKNNLNDDDIQKLVDTFYKILRNTRCELKLKVLMLNSNNFTIIGLGILAEFLKTNNSIEHLMLGNNNNFGNSGIQGAFILADALTINKSIHHLNLTMNSIPLTGIQALRAIQHVRQFDMEIDDPSQ